VRDPAVDKIVAHVERVGAHGVPDAVRQAAKAFIADTLGVGVAGVRTPWRATASQRQPWPARGPFQCW